MSAKGVPSSYSYWDENPVTGINYYRVKMIDAAGKSSYSRTVSATVKSGSFNVEAYPNPVKDIVTVRIHGNAGNDAAVDIMDIAGKIIRTVSMPDQSINIDMSGLAQGIYIIRYTDSHHNETIKLNKQ